MTLPFIDPPRSFPLAILPTLACVIALTSGCASEPQEGATTGWRSYTLGDSLSDPAYAVTVQSPYGADTLRTSAYDQLLTALRQETKASNRPPDTTLHRMAVRQFVKRHVMIGEAHRRKIEVDSQRLADRVERIHKNYSSEAASQNVPDRQRPVLESIRSREADDLRMEALWEMLAERAEVPTEAEIDAYRRRQRQQEVRLQYIFFDVDPQAPSQRWENVRSRAEAVLDSIEDGASFEKMARHHSDSPTAIVGGRTPRYKPEERFTGALGEALSTLQDTGEVVQEPIRTGDGIYIVRLEDRRSLLMSRGKAKWKLLSQRRRDSVKAGQRALMKDATVRVNPDVVFLRLDNQ
jgi:parvulin-like peptidyl-prolyl isomerase